MLTCPHMIANDCWPFFHLTRSVRGTACGALSYAAVPRVGLGPTAPPLCRYAERTAGSALPAWWAIRQVVRKLALRLVTALDLRIVLRLVLRPVTSVDSPGAWDAWRSGIKEESPALGRHGGQPRSQASQVPGQLQTRMRNSVHKKFKRNTNHLNPPSIENFTAKKRTTP